MRVEGEIPSPAAEFVFFASEALYIKKAQIRFVDVFVENIRRRACYTLYISYEIYK